jgi:hypothetical protein
MRSNRLKLKRFDEEESRPLTVQMCDFVISRGDELILPYLDIYDRDRIAQGKTSRQRHSSSFPELADARAVLDNFQTNSH